jgi:hypothetical protein
MNDALKFLHHLAEFSSESVTSNVSPGFLGSVRYQIDCITFFVEAFVCGH